MLRLMIALAVASVACGGKATPSESLSAETVGEQSLALIPADTPYVFIALDAYSSRMPWAPTMKDMYNSLAKVDKGEDTPGSRFIRRVLAEMKDGERFRTGRELGFPERGHFLLYGLSLWPVMRLAIADATKLRTVVGRIFTEAAPEMRMARRGGVTYWVGTFAEVSIVVGVLERELVVALLPTAQRDRALPVVLGLQPPPKSLAAGRFLDREAARRGFLRNWFGYMDSRKVIDLLAGGGQGFERELGQMWQRELATTLASCKDDFTRIARAFPRIVFGYRRLDAKVAEGAVIFESPEVGAALARTRGEVPQLAAPDERPLFAMSIAADVGKLVDWTRDVAAGLRARPFSCPGLDSLDRGLDDMASSVAQLPAMFRGLRGAAIVVDDVTLQPKSGTGTAIVVGDQVGPLVSMLWSTMPPLAGTQPPAFGIPVPIPLQQLGMPPTPGAHLALGSDRVAVAVGDDSASRVARTLAAASRPAAHLVDMSFDIARADELGLFDGKDRDSIEKLDYITVSFDATERGLELGFSGTWRNLRK